VDLSSPHPARGDRLATALGRVLATLVSVLDRVRPADKPMHPRGVVLTARLRRHGGAGTGAAHLDDAGDDAVLVRFSRSLGLPAPWPDVDGLALRVPTPGGVRAHADVLMSTTGRGRLSRYALLPTTRPRSAFLSTLVPYRSPTGLVHLAARAVDEHTWELGWARPRSPVWTAYAVLRLDDEPGRDLALSFDAVVAGPPGLVVPAWHRRVRGPSYAVARRRRGVTTP
jgi:hypothetical protein